MKQVHIPQELVDEWIGRVIVHFFGSADLFDAAFIHHHDSVGKLERLLLIVGDEDGCNAHLVMQPAQPAAQIPANTRIECAERLIQQQHAWLHRQRAGEGNTLALAARELPGKAVAQTFELDELQ